jgi:hypothetical protein
MQRSKQMSPSSTLPEPSEAERKFRATLAETRATLARAKAVSAEIAIIAAKAEEIADALEARRKARQAAYIRRLQEPSRP